MEILVLRFDCLFKVVLKWPWARASMRLTKDKKLEKKNLLNDTFASLVMDKSPSGVDLRKKRKVHKVVHFRAREKP